MANTSITETYENLPKIAKILIQFFAGAIISGAYRILRYWETRANVVTLVIGILCFLGLGFVFWIIDLVTEITSNRITVLAE